MTNRSRITSIALSFVLLFNIAFSTITNIYAGELITGKCGDNVTYSFNSSNGILILNGKGEMYEYEYLDTPFSNNMSIVTVKINEGISNIGRLTFCGCSNLQNIIIPNSLKNVGEYAFRRCYNLTNIFYCGSKDDWVNMTICANNSYLTDATLTCDFVAPCAFNNPCEAQNENRIEATCTSIGTYDEVVYCSVCATELSRTNREIPALGHDYSISTQIATCVVDGLKTYTCTRCGDSYTEIVKATGHKYKRVEYTAATCTENGIAKYTCSNCGDTYTKDIAKLGHNYVKTITKATPKKNGKIVTKCSRCGDSSTKTVYAPKYVELNANTFEYDGKVKTPKVVVYDSKDEIVNKSNYTVTYSKGRKKLGTYTVTVKFKGNYSGTVKKTFRIAPKRVKVSSIKVKAASTEEISVSWGKVKGVDGYEIYRWNDKEEKYKFYKKTTKTSIRIKRDSKKYNDVYFAIRTYKKVGKKTHKSVFTHEYGWVKLSAPSFKVEQEDFNEFTLIFSHKDRYDIQISNNKDFANSDSDRTKNRWTKSYREYCKKLCFGNAKSNKKYYVRARKYYYNKKGKLVVGPWSKVTVVKPY